MGLNNKATFLIIVICLANFIFFYKKLESSLMQSELSKIKRNLLNSVSISALGINYSKHKKIYKAYLSQKKEIENTKNYKIINKKLARFKEINNLRNDVYTVFVPYWAKESMIFLVTSNKKSYLGNGVKKTKLISSVYETKKPQLSDIYKTDEGTWISGAAPILDSKGNVHAVIQMDIDAEKELLAIIDKETTDILLPLGIISFIGMIIMVFGIRIFTNKLVKQILLISKSLGENIFQIKGNIGKSQGVSVDLFKVSNQLESTSSESEKITSNISGVVTSMSNKLNLSNSEVLVCERECSDGIDILHSLEVEIERIQKIMNSNTKSLNFLVDQVKLILDKVSNVKVKTTTINDITFQTKLLSFNASVEAARAGEAGKGFAVVAQEMGNLSDVSAQASSEIEEIMNETLADVQNTCDDIESQARQIELRSNKGIEDITKQKNSCREKFDSLQGKISLIRSTNIDIYDSFNQSDLAFALKELKENIEGVKEISLKNTSEANISKEISEELSQRFASLQNVSNSLSSILGSDTSE